MAGVITGLAIGEAVDTAARIAPDSDPVLIADCLGAFEAGALKAISRQKPEVT